MKPLAAIALGLDLTLAMATATWAGKATVHYGGNSAPFSAAAGTRKAAVFGGRAPFATATGSRSCFDGGIVLIYNGDADPSAPASSYQQR